MGDLGVTGSGGREPARRVAGGRQRQHWRRSGGALGALALLALGLGWGAVQAAPPVTEAWVARYNGPTSDLNEARKVVVDGAGNVYVTGYSRRDGILAYATVKYDASGAELWVARYNGGGNADSVPSALAVDGSGNVYVTGRAVNGSGTNFDYVTVKYNASGAQQWVASYDGPANSYDEARALAVDGSGNVYVTGYSDGSGTNFDYATVKYNASGAQQWVARYNGPANSYDEARALAVDGGGNVYVTGDSYGDDSSDYTTVKYNAGGTEQWARRYDGPAHNWDEANALAVDGAGNIVVTGVSGDGGREEYATVKYDTNGGQLWAQRYIGPGDIGAEARALAVDGAGNVYVTGSASYQRRQNDGNYGTVKYDASGTLLWAQSYTGPVNYMNRAEAIAVDGTGNVYVTGRSYNGTNYDYATVKYSQAAPDTTAPACAVQAVVTESSSRVFVPILVTDAGSGVAQVKLTANSTNCRLEWDGPGGVVTAPIGTPLSISPAAASTTVRVVKINTSQRARVELQVWDVAGNTAVCDPVIANLTVKNGNAPLVRVFNGIPQAERYVTLQNGTPGLTSATLTVNGRVVSQGGLTDGQVVALDVARWLRPGKNTVRIAARGPQNATAVLTIGDVAPRAGAALSARGAAVNLEFAP